MTERERFAVIKRLEKKTEGESLSKQNLYAGTNLLIIQTLDRLGNEKVREVSIRDYIACKNENYSFILQKFEALVELAKEDADAFIDTLHSQLAEMAAELKKTVGGVTALIQLAGLLRRLRFEGEDSIRKEVISIYSELTLSALAYLTRDKAGSVIVGVNTEGEIMTAPDQFLYANIAEWETVIKYLRTNEMDLSAFLRYKCISPPLEEMVPEAAATFLRRWKVFENVRAALFPYIDEYTYDIFPQDIAYTDKGHFAKMELDVDMAALHRQLAGKRKRALPVEGFTVEYEDQTGVLDSLLLKEISVDERVCVLYKLTTNVGEFSGYYYPDTDECYYAGMDYVYEDVGGEGNRFTIIKKLVMFFYAAAVLDDPRYTDATFEATFTNLFYDVRSHSTAPSNRIWDTMRRGKELGYFQAGAKKRADETVPDNAGYDIVVSIVVKDASDRACGILLVKNPDEHLAMNMEYIQENWLAYRDMQLREKGNAFVGIENREHLAFVEKSLREYDQPYDVIVLDDYFISDNG